LHTRKPRSLYAVHVADYQVWSGYFGQFMYMCVLVHCAQHRFRHQHHWCFPFHCHPNVLTCVCIHGCKSLSISVYSTDSRYLNYSVTQLRTQDTLSVLVYVSRNVHGRYLAWNFVRSNWNYISET